MTFSTCGEMHVIFWKLSPTLCLNTKCMLNKFQYHLPGYKRLGHTMYPVAVAKKDTINSDLKLDSEFT